MKITMLIRLLAVGALAAVLTFAQGGSKGGDMGGGSDTMGAGGAGGPGGAGGAGGGGFSNHVAKLDAITSMLKLNKDQKKQVKAIFDEGQKQAAPLRDQLSKGRLAVAEAAAAAKSPDEVDAAVKSYAAVEAQMASIEINSFAKVYQLLDKDQQQGAGRLYQMMPGMFKTKNWNE